MEQDGYMEVCTFARHGASTLYAFPSLCLSRAKNLTAAHEQSRARAAAHGGLVSLCLGHLHGLHALRKDVDTDGIGRLAAKWNVFTADQLEGPIPSWYGKSSRDVTCAHSSKRRPRMEAARRH